MFSCKLYICSLPHFSLTVIFNKYLFIPVSSLSLSESLYIDFKWESHLALAFQNCRIVCSSISTTNRHMQLPQKDKQNDDSRYFTMVEKQQ